MHRRRAAALTGPQRRAWHVDSLLVPAQLTVNGLAVGAIYALVALGLVL